MNQASFQGSPARPAPLRGADGPLAGLVAGAARPAHRLAIGITATVAAIDLLTSNVNLSIVYCLPMAIFARSARPGSIWRIALLLVLLGYAGYFLGPDPEPGASWDTLLFRYRMVNRTIAACSVLAIAAMAHFGIALRRRIDTLSDPAPTDAARTSDPRLFHEVVETFERFQAAAMAVVALAVVAAVDVLVPAQFNPAIAYSVPVIACARVRVRRFLWTMVAVALALIYAGLYLGPDPAVTTPELIERTVRNRQITSLMVFCIGAFVHLLIGIDAPVRRPTPAHVSPSAGVPSEF